MYTMNYQNNKLYNESVSVIYIIKFYQLNNQYTFTK